MFINLCERLKFRDLKFSSLIFLFTCFFTNLLEAQQIIRGTVVESDSNTVMPFVYIINKSNGNGTMSDNDGRFTLATNPNDTLICSYVGYLKLYIPVSKIFRNQKGEAKLIMSQMTINLSTVNVTTFKYKPYERDYMNEIIDRSRLKKLDNATSPISALYMRYSKEGKQIQKLAKIFEEVLMEEEVQQKLSREILVRLTGDEDIDYYVFRRYCYYLNDYYIVTHDGYELYSKVMDCYKKYKGDWGEFRKRDSDVKPANKELKKPDPDANWKKREEAKPQE